MTTTADLFREGYSYRDPTEMAASALDLDGLSFLRQAFENQGGAPIARTLDFQLVAVDFGTATFSATAQPWQYNPIGTVHGGMISTLLDSAAGCAVHSTLPKGRGYTSLDLSVKFLRPVTRDTGEVRAVGQVLNAGRRTALVEAKLLDAKDKLLAYAVSTCLLFDVPPSA